MREGVKQAELGPDAQVRATSYSMQLLYFHHLEVSELHPCLNLGLTRRRESLGADLVEAAQCSFPHGPEVVGVGRRQA